jgi:pheromone shutdown protein TraB
LALIDAFFEEVKLIVDDYLKSFFDSSTTQRTVLLPVDFKVPKDDCTPYVSLVGTAHFSKRSVKEALSVKQSAGLVGICLELCPYRYELLLDLCEYCLKKDSCSNQCEFTAVSRILDGTELDLWLIDMTQDEITARVLARATPEEAKSWKRVKNYIAFREAYGIKLWEDGLKEEAMRLFRGDLTLMRTIFPTLWRVLILERNALMACRMIYIVSRLLEKGLIDFKLIAFTGAAHVEGIRELLKKPNRAFQLLEQLGVGFSLPVVVRRV